VALEPGNSPLKWWGSQNPENNPTTKYHQGFSDASRIFANLVLTGYGTALEIERSRRAEKERAG
jgi:hypothetical protein